MDWMESGMGFDFEPFSAPVSPAEAVSNLRAVRLLEQVGQMSPKAHAFQHASELFVNGEYSLKQLGMDFADTFKTFADAAKSAEKANLITTQGREVVDGVMDQIRQEFEESMKLVKQGIDAVESSQAFEYAREFCEAAHKKLDKLSVFWDNTLKKNQVEEQVAGSFMKMEIR